MNRAIKCKSVHQRRRGMALLLVTLAIVLAAMLAMTFLAGQSTNTGISLNARNQTRARAIAEAALQMAVTEVRSNADWRTTFTNGAWATDVALDGGTYTIIGEDGKDTNGDGVIEGDGDLANKIEDPVTITAIGRFDGVAHVVRAVVNASSTGLVRLLLVVPDPAHLADEFAQRKTQAQKWGYVVSTIADSATQSEFDAAVAANNVVWVAQSPSAVNVGNKLTNAPIGVVNEAPVLWDALGITPLDAGTGLDRHVKVTSNSHYITEPFALGNLMITGVNQTQSSTAQTLASGADLLAQKTNGTGIALAAMDAGRTMSNGAAAEGRRVVIPSGRVDLLTDDGLTLVKRALEWGYSPPVGPPPVAHWMLDETSGAIAHDAMGTNHGDVYGAPNWVLGQVVGALEFDGVNDYVQIPNSPTFQITKSLTIMGWIKGDEWGASDNVDIILRKGEGNPNKWQFAVKDGKATLFLEDYDDYGIKGSTKLATNRWYHVAATWDGAKVRIYVDGVADNGNGQNRSAPITTDSRPVYIGGRAGTTDLFKGLMDDVRLYDRALSNAEIRVIYEEGKKTAFVPRLVSEYRFEETKPTPKLIGQWKLEEAGTGGGGLVAGSYMRISDTPRIDSYDGSKGAYGGTNVGFDAFVATNSTGSSKFKMDVPSSLFGHAFCGASGNPSTVIDAHTGSISGKRLAQAVNAPISDQPAPTGMPATQGSVNVTNARTWNSNQTFSTLTLDSGAKVTVVGNVKVQCTSNFVARGNATVTLNPGAKLTIYVAGTTTIYGTASLHSDTTSPDRLTIIGYNSSSDITIKDQAVVCGLLYSDRTITISDTAAFYGGGKAASDVYIQDDSRVHLDMNLANMGITDPPTFDVLHVNTGQLRNGAVGLQTGATGFTGNAVKLDGVNDYVEIPHHDSYLLRSGAIALWFKTTDASRTQGLFSKDSSGYDTGGQVTLSITGGKVRAHLESTTTSYDLYTSAISTNKWYQVLFAFGPDGARLYLNGVRAASNTYTGGLGKTSGGSGNYEPITVGADLSSSGDLTTTGVNNFLVGWIDDVCLYDYAVDDKQADDIYKGSSLTPSTLPGSIVYDAGVTGGAVNLNIPDTSKVAWVADGLKINSPTTIMSDEGATKIKEAVALTNQMSLELIFTPADVSQGGPARIATFSADDNSRNFTFGQKQKAYSMRLRTSNTTSNGTPDIDSPDRLTAGGREHVIVTYDGANVVVWRNGAVDMSSPRTGTFGTWDKTYLFAVANEITGAHPWLGTLHRVAVYDRAFNSLQARNVFSGQPPGDGQAPAFSMQWVERP